MAIGPSGKGPIRRRRTTASARPAALVARYLRAALADLPEPYASRLSNVDFVVVRHPSVIQRRRAGLAGGTLYGLYEGVPLPQRGSWYGDASVGLQPPDKITVFWGPLVRDFPDPADLEDQVRKTLYHEIAHHFGMSDLELGGTSVE